MEERVATAYLDRGVLGITVVVLLIAVVFLVRYVMQLQVRIEKALVDQMASNAKAAQDRVDDLKVSATDSREMVNQVSGVLTANTLALDATKDALKSLEDEFKAGRNRR